MLLNSVKMLFSTVFLLLVTFVRGDSDNSNPPPPLDLSTVMRVRNNTKLVKATSFKIIINKFELLLIIAYDLK